MSREEGLEKSIRSTLASITLNHGTTQSNDSRSLEGALLPKYPKASLGGIPEEILLNITTCLRNDQCALAKLCRTNRRCKRIAEAVLYEHIGGPQSHHKEAYAISHQPALAKNLRICTYIFQSNLERESEGDAYLRVLENAHNIRDLTWMEEFDVTKEPTKVSARIHLDSLNKLFTLFNKAVNEPFGDHNRFMQLTDLQIEVGTSSGHFFPTEMLSSLFRLPVLISLSLTGFDQPEPFRNWTVPASTSSVRVLSLWNGLLGIAAVTQMIASIKTLDYLFWYRMPWEPFGAENDELPVSPKHSWKLLGQALRQHRDCLEELDLSRSADSPIYLSDRDSGVLGSFAEFPKLKYLSVPIEAILDIETGEKDLSSYLPEQLETFEIIVQTTNTDAIASYIWMMDALWKSINPNSMSLALKFDNLPMFDEYETLRLIEALELAEKSKISKNVDIQFSSCSLDEVVRSRLWSILEGLEVSSGEEGGEGEDEDEDEDGSSDEEGDFQDYMEVYVEEEDIEQSAEPPTEGQLGQP